MALIKLKRNWFGPNGVRYRAREGLHQISEEMAKQAPSDAVLFDDGGKPLPSLALEPVAGFGAKPMHEQLRDLVPSPVAPAVEVELTEEEVKKRDAEAEKARAETAAKVAKEAEAAHDDDQAKVTESLIIAEKVRVDIEKVTDPIAAASAATAKSPTPVATSVTKK